MQVLLDALDAERLERMRQVARTLDAAGHVRDDRTVDQAADILWTYTSPQLYDALVETRGWTAAQFGSFIADALTPALAPLR